MTFRFRPRSRPSRAVLLLALGLPVLAGCGGTSHGASASGGASGPAIIVQNQPGQATPAGKGPVPKTGMALDQPVPAAVANLPLVDQDGRRFTLAGLHGKTVVLTDFLTLCQEVCPMTSANVSGAQQAVARAGLGGQVVFVEATVDPGRDTPARLAAYQKLFGATPDWRFATGSAADLARLWKFFGVYYAKVAEDPGPPPKDWWTGKPLTYDVQHQDVVYVLGPDGHERWEDTATPDARGQALPHPLATFLNAQGRQNQSAPSGPTWTAGDVEQALTYVTGQKVG